MWKLVFILRIYCFIGFIEWRIAIICWRFGVRARRILGLMGLWNFGDVTLAKRRGFRLILRIGRPFLCGFVIILRYFMCFCVYIYATYREYMWLISYSAILDFNDKINTPSETIPLKQQDPKTQLYTKSKAVI